MQDSNDEIQYQIRPLHRLHELRDRLLSYKLRQPRQVCVTNQGGSGAFLGKTLTYLLQAVRKP